MVHVNGFMFLSSAPTGESVDSIEEGQQGGKFLQHPVERGAVQADLPSLAASPKDIPFLEIKGRYGLSWSLGLALVSPGVSPTGASRAVSCWNFSLTFYGIQ